MFRSNAAPVWALAALAAGFVPMHATAAPVTLRYDFRAVIASTWYSHWCFDYDDCQTYEAGGDATTYQGPPVSSRGPGWIEVTLDYIEEYGAYEIDFSYSILGLPNFFGGSWPTWATYDAVTKALSLVSYTYDDDFSIDLAPGEGYAGSGYVYWEQDRSGVDHARADFWLFDVTVTDPTAPQPAPVPLPAALPLLAGALAGLGLLRRRARG